MKSRIYLFVLFVVLCLLPPPSHAASIFIANGSSTITIGTGDSFEFVELLDTAHLDFTGGTISNDLILLDSSTATMSGGTIGGKAQVFDKAALLVQTGADDLAVDGTPEPLSTVLDASSCPLCSVTATLADQSALAATTLVAQGGTVHFEQVSQVPEPSSLAMAAMGLIGIVFFGRRR